MCKENQLKDILFRMGLVMHVVVNTYTLTDTHTQITCVVFFLNEEFSARKPG